MSTVIFWRTPLGSRNYEEFDSMDAAMVELETYKTRFPWNTYYVASVVLVHEATAAWKDPIQYVVSQEHAPQSDAEAKS